MSLGKPTLIKLRKLIQDLIQTNSSSSVALDADVFIKLDQNISMELPCVIGDYTDFYASKYHATNVGELFRGKDNALNPNWYTYQFFRVHMPIGYHGRSSSVIVSGTEIKRPKGIVKDGEKILLDFTRKLDFELEIGVLIGKGNVIGDPIKVENAHEHIFGFVLVNDWSARDIQAWEYVPLGPFLGKSFATSISPWVITPEALEQFRIPIESQETQTPEPMHHLRKIFGGSFDITLEIELISSSNEKKVLSKTNAALLYWDFFQMIAHHTSNGCNLRSGDLCASGTISGGDPTSLGSLLEMNKNGTNLISIGQEQRGFLENGDTVVLRGYCKNTNITIGFGDCFGKIVA